MALSIKHADADRLARQLAATTGETLTDAVVVALRERLERERARRRVGTADRLRRLAAEVAGLPVLDPRPADAIVGYDEHGLAR
ncbi:MAG: type II toxin-antitoxin system VapB family antitoxin [Actinomycetota bacterium]